MSVVASDPQYARIKSVHLGVTEAEDCTQSDGDNIPCESLPQLLRTLQLDIVSLRPRYSAVVR